MKIDLGANWMTQRRLRTVLSPRASYAPPPLPVLPEWSPAKVFGGYGAPLDVAKAARAGVPVLQHQHNSACHQHGCDHAAHQLLAGIEAARTRFAGFWGLGCDCFAF
jgi:hypothetical protein